MVSTAAKCSSATPGAAHSAVIPFPMALGVLGMIRRMGNPSGDQEARVSVVAAASKNTST